MAKDILMPLLSPSMTEGTLVKWIKKEGDTIKSGEIIAEVETDKATMDLEAFDSGILRKILVEEGAKVPVQTRIGIIGTKDEKYDISLLVKNAFNADDGVLLADQTPIAHKPKVPRWAGIVIKAQY